MKDNAEIFSDIMTRFRFTEPVNPGIQEHIRRIKSSQFKKTLKRAGGYSFAFGLTAWLFFLLKKLGINVTIIKSAAILTLSVSAAGISAGAGVYQAVKYFVKPQEKAGQIEAPLRENIPAVTDAVKETAPESPDIPESLIIKSRIGIQMLSAENTEKRLAGRITNTLAAELSGLRGADYVANYAKQKEQRKSGMILKGSVEFLNGTYNINVKLVDVNTLKILFYTSEAFRAEDDVKDACRKIAERIAEAREVPGPAGK